MKKDDMVKELVDRIQYNIEQRDYYGKKSIDDNDGYHVWREMESWYQGRVSAFNIALMMLDPSHPMVQ